MNKNLCRLNYMPAAATGRDFAQWTFPECTFPSLPSLPPSLLFFV